jgi:hypothetical protein
MNKIHKRFRIILAVCMTGLLAGAATHVYAEDKDCWADFFEESQYAGKHLLIKGTRKLENLKNVEGENWNQRIHSIKIGAKAKVTVYQNPRFELSLTEMAKKPDLMKAWGITEQDIKEDSELIFTGEAQIHDLGDFNFHKKIRSLKVDCIN